MNTDQLTEANVFFNDQASNILSSDYPYADSDGLLQFIVDIPHSENPEVRDKLNQLRGYLLSLTAIAADAILRKRLEDKTNMDVWSQVMSLLFMKTTRKPAPSTYSKTQKGAEIAPAFITELLAFKPKNDTAQLNSFRSFLKGEGELVRAKVDENSVAYKTMTLGLRVKLIQRDNATYYEPTIRLRQVNFTRANSEWVTRCNSDENVDVSFQYTGADFLFDYALLNDPITKKKIDTFIDKNKRVDIQDSSTFFNADFPTE